MAHQNEGYHMIGIKKHIIAQITRTLTSFIKEQIRIGIDVPLSYVGFYTHK